MGEANINFSTEVVSVDPVAIKGAGLDIEVDGVGSQVDGDEVDMVALVVASSDVVDASAPDTVGAAGVCKDATAAGTVVA